MALAAGLVGWSVAACEERSAADPATRSRVVAVAVPAGSTNSASSPNLASLADLCDVRDPGHGAVLTWPALVEGAPPAASEGWRWINVWATWCRPCVEEIPLLVDWSRQLRSERVPIDLVFLSADEDAGLVSQFRAAHPEMPATLRAAGGVVVQAWIQSLGLSPDTPLPIHLFVDPARHVRCARSGAMGPTLLPAITELTRRM